MRGKKRILNDIVIDEHRLLSPPYAGHRVVHSNGFYVSAVAHSKAWVVGLQDTAHNTLNKQRRREEYP
jgi:hypothetical protein